MHTHTHTHTEREGKSKRHTYRDRQRDREKQTHVHTHVHDTYARTHTLARAHMTTWIVCDHEMRGRVQRKDSEGGKGRDMESAQACWLHVCERISDGAGEEGCSDRVREKAEDGKEIREPRERGRGEGSLRGQSER